MSRLFFKTNLTGVTCHLSNLKTALFENNLKHGIFRDRSAIRIIRRTDIPPQRLLRANKKPLLETRRAHFESEPQRRRLPPHKRRFSLPRSEIHLRLRGRPVKIQGRCAAQGAVSPSKFDFHICKHLLCRRQKTNCPAYMRFRVSDDGCYLVLVAMNLKHNHEPLEVKLFFVFVEGLG